MLPLPRGEFLFQDLVREVHALVADLDRWTKNHACDFMLGLPQKVHRVDLAEPGLSRSIVRWYLCRRNCRGGLDPRHVPQVKPGFRQGGMPQRPTPVNHEVSEIPHQGRPTSIW